MITTINPYTQQKIEEYSFLTNNALSEQLTACEKTYIDWKQTSLEERKSLGQKLASLVLEQKQELATLISTEMGKPIQQSLIEIEKTAGLVTYFSEKSEKLLNNKTLDADTYLSYHPTGAVFGIMPWNFPFWQVFRYAILNIMGGNICLLKHAPNVTGCALAIQQLFEDAGFPKNVFTTLIIDIPQIEQVISHPVVQGVCVTGSTKAGSAVASLAGKYLKKSVLELGGTDAFVILEDANFENALDHAFNSRIANAGQICIAAKRIFVPKNNIDKAIAFLNQKLTKLQQGNPLEKSTEIGPISKAEFLPTLQKQVEKTITHGAQLVTGGKINAPFYEPTLLLVNRDNPMLKEEIFGPVLCIIPFEDEQTLVEDINNSDYGLGASIWSTNMNKAKQLAAKINVGYVAINKNVSSDARFPFGGIKNSGYGKELGEDGFKTFLNVKTNVVG